ncbi:hypothetical protein Tco_0349838 [Tanacetum coccineum]
MAGEEDDTRTNILHEEDEAVESGDISILNLLIGHGSPRSFQLWGKVGICEVHVLIDNGSTHKFMEVDLYVLPMKGPDVVLMIQWLQKLGKVTHDYSQQNMEFTLDNKTYLLQWYESLRMKRISLHRMQALLETDDVYGVYELHNLSVEKKDTGSTSTATGLGHLEIDQHFVKYDTLFQKLVNEMLGQGSSVLYQEMKVCICSCHSRILKAHHIEVRSSDGPEEDCDYNGVVGLSEAKAFEGLKQQLTNTTIIGLPNFNEILLWSSMLRRRVFARLLPQLKQNLLAAKHHMEMKANRKRPEVSGSPEEATWEWLSEFRAAYPAYDLEDRVNFEGGWNVTPAGQDEGCTKKITVAPAWHKDFVMG